MQWFYPIYAATGRSVLIDDLCDAELGENDPFALAPRTILERVFRLGMTPVVEQARSEPWYVPGATHRLDDQGDVFLVTVSRDAEVILVQEERPADDPYGEGE